MTQEESTPSTLAEKWAAITAAGKVLDKTYESKTFQKYGEKVGAKVPVIPTNLLSVDWDVLGCGGLPKGRIIEVYGPESSGKTALCSHIIGQCQKSGGIAAFIDAEHAYDPTFATKMGVNMDDLLVSQPDYGEQALEIAIALVETKSVDLIVVDSVSALVPKAELEGDMGDSHMGLQARLMSQAMRKLVGIVSKTGTTIIFINQIREKIGVMFGNPQTTSGGRALKFAASVRIEVIREAISKGGLLKDGDVIIGHKMRVKNVKNKAGAPYREDSVDLYYDTGFDIRESAIDQAVKLGLVTGTAWLVLKGSDEKYRRDDLPLDKVAEAVASYYSDQYAKQEAE